MILAATAGSGCASDADGGAQQTSDTVRGCPTYAAPVSEPSEDTYDGFPSDFFARYCTRCHASGLTTPEDRSFAPALINLDDEAQVREALLRVRRVLGEVNTMPPSPPTPSCDDRLRLVRWIDSGAP